MKALPSLVNKGGTHRWVTRVESTGGPVLCLGSQQEFCHGLQWEQPQASGGQQLELQQMLCIMLKRSWISNSSSFARRSDPFPFVPLVRCCLRSSCLCWRKATADQRAGFVICAPYKYPIKADGGLCKRREELVGSGRLC